ncbi:hypothetical protein AB4142_08590 [Variovorax sp. 2RAF20]
MMKLLVLVGCRGAHTEEGAPGMERSFASEGPEAVSESNSVFA